jgi:hypothetical protein
VAELGQAVGQRGEEVWGKARQAGDLQQPAQGRTGIILQHVGMRPLPGADALPVGGSWAAAVTAGRVHWAAARSRACLPADDTRKLVRAAA